MVVAPLLGGGSNTASNAGEAAQRSLLMGTAEVISKLIPSRKAFSSKQNSTNFANMVAAGRVSSGGKNV